MSMVTHEKTADQTVEENRVAGSVGAFLFALAGGAIYFVLWQVGYVAAISGLIAVVCAMKGYELFAKKESRFGIIISVVMSVLVISIAWYLCLSLDVYQAYQEWYEAGEVDSAISFGDAVRNAYLFLSDPKIARSYLLNLAFGIALCALGCISPIRAALRRTKKTATAQPEAAPTASADAAQNDTFASEDFNYDTGDRNDTDGQNNTGSPRE